MIFVTNFALYAAISIYVHVKFKAFGSLSDESSSSNTESRRSNLGSQDQGTGFASSQNMASRKVSTIMAPIMEGDTPPQRPEWDNMDFITSAPHKDKRTPGIAAVDVSGRNSGSSSSPNIPAVQNLSTFLFQNYSCLTGQRKASEVPTVSMNSTKDTQISNGTVPTVSTVQTGITDQLRSTRKAILRQLRSLFIYPVIYLQMWLFPLANHFLQ